MLFLSGIKQCAVIFAKAVKFGASVWQCRHPEVNQYINRVLVNASKLQRLSGFSISTILPNMEPIDEVLVDLQSSAPSILDTDGLVHLHENLKSSVVKMCICLSNMPPITEGKILTT